MKRLVRKQDKKININRNEIIPHLGGNGPPCPSSWEHLSLGWEAMAWRNGDGGEGERVF